MDNNIFSFERFLKVLKYDLKMRVPAVGTMFLVLLAMPHVLHQLMDFGNSFPEGQRFDIYAAMCVIFVFYIPFKIYSAFRQKHELGSFIMLPASSLEKFASMVSISLILVPAAFMLSIYLLDAVLVLLFSSQYGTFVTIDYMVLFRGAVGLFSIIGAAILGNVFFKKAAPAKTLLCILTLAFLWGVVISGYIYNNLFADGNVDIALLQLKAETVESITAVVYFVAAIFFYAFTYLRIRKIQIS